MDATRQANAGGGRTKRLAVWLLAAAVACGQAGCVSRRMTIRSNPPGALVFVDNYEIGTTPVSTDFIYYGTREIRLVADGYETLTINQPLPPPWYQVFPVDFFAENVVPGEIRDERVLDYQMVPQVATQPDQLLQRAENLRRTSGPAVLGVPPVSSMQAFPEPVPLPAPSPEYLPAPNIAPSPSPGYTPYP